MRRPGFYFRGFNLGLRVFLRKGWRSWADHRQSGSWVSDGLDRISMRATPNPSPNVSTPKSGFASRAEARMVRPQPLSGVTGMEN